MAGKKQTEPRRAGTARLTHLDDRGRIRMVDVGEKPVTRREAIARGEVRMAPATLQAIIGGKLKKGEALAAARIKMRQPRGTGASRFRLFLARHQANALASFYLP